MSQQPWQKLLETEDGALTGCLSLSQVSISRKTGNMRVSFQSSRLLSRNEYKLVSNRMAGAFPQVRVETSLYSPLERSLEA